jgi:two-component system, NarL family, invasion response regulator UvrY
VVIRNYADLLTNGVDDDGVKLAVAAHDPVVRKGFREIARARPDWTVAAEVGKAAELLELLRSEPIDLVVLDVPLGEYSGLELIRTIRAEFPQLPVVIVSAYPEAQYAIPFLRAGANAFLRRNVEPAEILTAIASVAGGERYVTSAVAAEVARNLEGGAVREPHEHLSAREFEVFRMLALGMSPTEIGKMLNLSIKTISTYRARILEKTRLRSNADIVGYAIRNNLV